MAVAIGVIATGLSRGGHPLGVRTGLAIVVWWTVIVAVGFSLWPRTTIPRVALAAGGAFAGLALLTGLSALWAPSAEAVVDEFNRATLYLGFFALTVLASRRGEAAGWADGLALGLIAIGLAALGSRCFPGLFPESQLPRFLPSAATRLSYPVNYWNGLGIAIGLAVPLILRAATAEARAALRGLWLAPVPALVVALYLTSSRGGFAVAGASLVLFLALSGPRLVAVAQAAVVAICGSLAAVLAIQSHPRLVDGPLDAAAAAQGQSAALELLAVCVATGLIHALVSRTSLRTIRVGRRGLAIAAGLATVALTIGTVAADVSERVATFKSAQGFVSTDEQDFVRSHLLSGNGSGRWQFWSSAVDQWQENPVVGGGAGTYESWWAQHGSLSYFVRNAHSLWLETLGELGLAGLLLLLGFFAIAVLSGVSRLRDGDDALTVPALTAVAVAFALGAALDWVWEFPAVAGIGVIALALLTGPATLRPANGLRVASAPRRRSRFGVGVVGLVVGWCILSVQVIPWLMQREINASQAASARGDDREALDRAEQARRIGSWAATPWQQAALVEEQAGELRSAQRSIAEAIRRDERNWRLLVISARINARAGALEEARSDLLEARRLSPKSPLLSSLSR